MKWGFLRECWCPGRTFRAGLVLTVVTALTMAANTGFHSPPRHDGAGYAVLGWSLALGEGYRDASHPTAPRHSHFPPGYPLALAALFLVFGPSFPAAHALSLALTVAAVLVHWVWFRRLVGPRTAWLLGLALALNWTWGRIGGTIQSEPLYCLLSGMTLLAVPDPRGRRPGRGILLGVLIAATVLTRHVGVCLALAVIVAVVRSGRIAVAWVAFVTAGCAVAPWLAWLVWVGHGSQAGLFEGADVFSLIGRQLLFYTRRIPDQLFGPFVEVATVYVQRPVLALGTAKGRWLNLVGVATAGAAIGTAVVGLGWWHALRSSRRRLAGLVPTLTLPLLLVWPFTEAGRFLVPLVPFLLIGAVEGLAILLRRWGPRHPRRFAAWLLLALSLPYSVYSWVSGRAEAQRQTYRDFDAACRWIGRHASRPGPVLTHYPADVFWLTGRKALETHTPDATAIARLIDQYGVAYLLVDEHPFTNAPIDPLSLYVDTGTARVRRVWGPQGAVSVYAVDEVERPL